MYKKKKPIIITFPANYSRKNYKHFQHSIIFIISIIKFLNI